jgi:FkbH-like protein
VFETHNYLQNFALALPEQVVHRFEELRHSIAKRSLIVWGEHCSECAAPACYSTCSFYTPRTDDLNCGRFAKGIQTGRIGEVRLATLNFRKWGRLFGIGPVGLIAQDKTERREHVNDLVSGVIANWVPSLALPRAQWTSNQWKGRGSRRYIAPADAFVIEAWLDDRYPTFSFTLTVIPRDDSNSGLFQVSFQLGQGYSRLIVPAADISARIDLAKPYSIQIEPLEDSIGRDITFGLLEFVTFRHGVDEVRPARRLNAKVSVQPMAAKAKCVVWDLDNTVWQGTLAEDGLEGLVLNSAVKATIEELDRRGTLHSVASKNDPQQALAALEAFGLREYFLYPQIGWTPKSTSIEQIAALLDIGLDTVVFLDDQAFERGEVGERLPQVTVLSDADLPNLLENPLFDVPITAESSHRRSMYLAEQRRKATFESTTGDYIEFLRGCSIHVDVSMLSAALVERAYELSQRTNQLNVSGRRYSRSELMAFQSPDSPAVAYLFSCRDRFGEYGTIAMCVLNPREAQIESYMMSCRVQRKRVEHAVFAWLTRKCANAGFDTISVTYNKTKRNDASIRMLEELGFSYHPTSPVAGAFVRPTGVPIADADIVMLQDRTEDTEDTNHAS